MQKLDSLTFDDLLRRSGVFQNGDAESLFDLRGVELITPAALVQLAAAAHALAAHGKNTIIEVDDDSVRSYLVRAGFITAIDGVAEIRPYLAPSGLLALRGTNPLLIEVTKLTDASKLPELLDQIVWVLQHRLSYKKYDSFDIAMAVSEISQNVFDHNSNISGFLAMQVYNKGKFLEIGIADNGNGLRNTLRRNRKYISLSTDSDAIRHAIRLGISEHDDVTRGTGLYHLLDLTYKHEGSVQIRSGTAKARYRMDKKQGWVFAVPDMPGVQIALTLPSK